MFPGTTYIYLPMIQSFSNFDPLPGYGGQLLDSPEFPNFSGKYLSLIFIFFCWKIISHVVNSVKKKKIPYLPYFVALKDAYPNIVMVILTFKSTVELWIPSALTKM